MSALTLSANVNNNIPGVAFNDLYLDSQGNIAVSTDLQAILEECAQAARTLLGECIYNTNIGVPYEQVLWVGVPNIEQFTAALRQTFLGVDGVTEVTSLIVSQSPSTSILSQSADMISFTAIIQTIYGTGTIQ
jgi:hypothetical protein